MVDREQLESAAARVRANLDAADLDAAGNCFLAAAALREILGDDIQRVTGLCRGDSHEWAAVEVDGELLHVDLTGDQFGFPAVQIVSDLPEEYSDWIGAEWDEALIAEFAADVATLTD
jgi:hypothetical protein